MQCAMIWYKVSFFFFSFLFFDVVFLHVDHNITATPRTHDYESASLVAG